MVDTKIQHETFSAKVANSLMQALKVIEDDKANSSKSRLHPGIRVKGGGMSRSRRDVEVEEGCWG